VVLRFTIFRNPNILRGFKRSEKLAQDLLETKIPVSFNNAGGGIRTHEPLRDGISRLPLTGALKSHATTASRGVFDQAQQPPRSHSTRGRVINMGLIGPCSRYTSDFQHRPNRLGLWMRRIPKLHVILLAWFRDIPCRFKVHAVVVSTSILRNYLLVA
jgi:hypothetical protein